MRGIGFLAILPATVRYSEYLSAKEKLLYCEISAMMDIEGSVPLTPEVIGYLSDLFSCTADTTMNKVHKLEKEGHLEIRDGTLYASRYSNFKIDNKPVRKQDIKVDDLPEKVEGFVKYWNKLYGTKMRATSRLMLLMNARLKTFSIDEIKSASSQRKKALDGSDWHNKPENIHHKNSYDKFLRNDDELQKYLQVETEKGNNYQLLEF